MVAVKGKALKDEARIFGLILSKGAPFLIEVEEDRMSMVQAAVDAGEVEVDGMAKTAPKLEKKEDKKDPAKGSEK